MRGEPWFWRSSSLAAKAVTALLTPAALAYQGAHHLRWAMTQPAHAPVPVVCIGAASLGGAGKTPFAMMLAALLQREGFKPAFLTRGYGGALAGPVQISPDHHGPDDVGDEALLLAACAPTIVARKRPAGAALAASIGAGMIIMDDGFQNPTLHKDVSILLMDDAHLSTPAHVFPAGPYRETIANARARADITVAMSASPAHKADADFNAWLEPVNAPPPQRVVAFAGIGRPQNFFSMLETLGFDLAGQIAFPDHHHFTQAERDVLTRKAKSENATLIATQKDCARLPPDFSETVLSLKVDMRINDAAALKDKILAAINTRQPLAAQK